VIAALRRSGLLAALGAAGACAAPAEPADLVLRGGKIVTLDAARPSATALAARGGRIVAVGTDEEIRPFVGEATEIVELAGRLAVPGFIEGHGHFTGLGASLVELDLDATTSWDEIVQLAARAAREAAPGAWIVGRGWHQERWTTPPEPAVEGYPTHQALSEAVPGHPVLLVHASGHASIANRAALREAGIDRGTADPPGGRILRDASGEPTGVLRETASAPVEAARERWERERDPRQREAEARRQIRLADRECLSKGITSFQDAGSDFETIGRLRAMAEAGEIGVRLWVMMRADEQTLAARAGATRTIGAAGDHLTVRALKVQIDGALGSHGAWLLEPYADLPGTSGLNTTPLAVIERLADLAATHDLQLCVHAIGDRANRETLDAYERAFARHGGGRDRRWRIEHAQHLHPADVPRFAALGVVASMQGVHCTSDGPWVEERLGAARVASGAYVWRDLLDSGATIANGTDAPVEDVDPLANFYASVTRRMADGRAFHPEQRMSREEALRAGTLAAAWAAFEEPIKGSLAPGKLADVTVLSHDILSIPEEEIRAARVDATIVGGEVLYRRQGSR
jgi:predicted amidohydrolase YtcJ